MLPSATRNAMPNPIIATSRGASQLGKGLMPILILHRSESWNDKIPLVIEDLRFPDFVEVFLKGQGGVGGSSYFMAYKLKKRLLVSNEPAGGGAVDFIAQFVKTFHVC